MSPRFGPESPPRIRRRLLALHVELELHRVSVESYLPFRTIKRGKILTIERTYKWEHVETPLIRHEAAVHFLRAGLTASGVQYGDGYEATWELRTAENWVTERVSVNVEGDGWGRSLELFRSEQGVWSAETNEEGAQPEDLPSPGIVQSADLKAALDCDLGLCPLTNTMPIRRLTLLETQVPKTQLIMAWIDIPSLQVIASDQYYSSVDAETVRYESGTRGVDVELEVDGGGVVVHYPDLARRV